MLDLVGHLLADRRARDDRHRHEREQGERCGDADVPDIPSS
jgi:hypothetical protein